MKDVALSQTIIFYKLSATEKCKKLGERKDLGNKRKINGDKNKNKMIC